MINVSDTAKIKLTQLMSEDGFAIGNDYVRVGVKSGGCSGLSYDLTFDKTTTDTDKIFEANDVRIVVDKKAFYISLGRRLNLAVV
ncbi:probable iron binding protein from the HesB_IscA_SufA family [Nonlabens ulvanivorans]|uniref:Probable iron binding protein from the HesB_IscA_SufA family n=1 Tax=Nonlabens ulvanivorans TaxID=906888 RepID=A0A090Q6P3_NONUL|nr:probable iron binding protein from the HesB_IscA_SufA family [Nonlabens ulvanivorans]GAL74050.1 probable iron binding protein from the HesB_IscA_SufA family [Nonlabens ulvanivorans]